MNKTVEGMFSTEQQLNSRTVQQELAFAALVMNATEDLLVAADAKGFKRADLARILGVSRSNVHRQLAGERNMTLRTLSKMAFVLGFDARVVLTPHASEGDSQCTFKVRDVATLTVRQPSQRNVSGSGSALRFAATLVKMNDARAA